MSTELMVLRLFAEIDMMHLLPFAAFGLVMAAMWLIFDWMSKSENRAEQRLEEFHDPTLRRRREDARSGSAKTGIREMISKATPALARPLQPKSEEEASKLKLRLIHAGFRSESAPTFFLGVKFAFLVIGFMAGGGTVATLAQQNGTGLLTTGSLMKLVGIAGVSFFLPDVGLWFLSRRRREAIFLGLPDALDLMVVCVEAGLGLDQALRKVAEEMKKSYPVIAEEFGLCNLQMQMGRARAQVLQELGQRSGVEDLRSLAAILIQADKFGSSIAQALRVQSDSMRTRRQQIAEEKAAKTAVKLIFPLVLFIFPGIFVVLVGPAAITMVNQMFPAMSGG